MTNNRVIKKISLNEDSRDIVIQFRGSSQAIEAKALDFQTDEAGNVVYLLLDRLIHNASETAFDCCLNNQRQDGYWIEGCYVSELKRAIVEQ